MNWESFEESKKTNLKIFLHNMYLLLHLLIRLVCSQLWMTGLCVYEVTTNSLNSSQSLTFPFGITYPTDNSNDSKQSPSLHGALKVPKERQTLVYKRCCFCSGLNLHLMVVNYTDSSIFSLTRYQTRTSNCYLRSGYLLEEHSLTHLNSVLTRK